MTVDANENENEPELGELVNPYMLALAAQGSIDAQRILARGYWDFAAAGGGPFPQMLTVAEVFGRMAASHGEASDLEYLAGLLIKRAERLSDTHDDMVHSAAVAMCLLDEAADRGSDKALEMLTHGASIDLPAAVFELAAAFRRDGGVSGFIHTDAPA